MVMEKALGPKVEIVVTTYEVNKRKVETTETQVKMVQMILSENDRVLIRSGA